MAKHTPPHASPVVCKPSGGALGQTAPSPGSRKDPGEPEQVEKQLLGAGSLVSHAAGVAMERKSILDLNFSTPMLQLAYEGHRTFSRAYSALPIISLFTY